MSEADHWQAVEQLFHAALALPAGEREAFLDERCAGDRALLDEVRSLLRHAGNDAPSRDAVERVAQQVLASQLPSPGEHLGAYRVLQPIGRGGMGAVYLAERADEQFHRQVAIKVIRSASGLGHNASRHFRRERQILANLQHPNIARLLDGGSTPDGLPYLVMEYVDGVNILEYCRRHRLGLRGRLALLAKVCEAVTYAHRELVVHRDLKPSNILVDTAGQPRLLDFGIARLLDQAGVGKGGDGGAGDRQLTPHYASPEQLRGEPATTQADVYALGVILYQLLAGCLPLPYAEARSETTGPGALPAPSERSGNARLRRQLAGDLDAIALKALHPESGSRYHSVAELARDIGQYLERRPVAARPAHWHYVARRFIARNRAASLVTLLLALSVAGFGLALLDQARELRRERDLAQRQLARANAFSGYLENLFSGLDPDVARGRDITVREMLERTDAQPSAGLDGATRRQPDAAAAIHRVLGSTYSALGILPEAQRQLERARELYQSGGATDPREHLRTLLALSRLYNLQFRVDERLTISREARDLARSLYPEDHPLSLRALSALASARHMKGDLQGAAQDFRALYKLNLDRFGPDHKQSLGALDRLAVINHWQGHYDRAETHYRQCLTDARRALGNRHTVTLSCLGNLGSLLDTSGRYTDAIPVLTEHLQLATEVLGPEHPATLRTRHNLADSYRGLGEYDRAEALFLDILATRREVLGSDHVETLQTQVKLARLYRQQGRFPESIALTRDTLDKQRTALGKGHPTPMVAAQILADTYLEAGQLDAAADLLGELLPARLAALGPEHPDLIATHQALAELARRRGKPERAQQHAARAAAVLAQNPGFKPLEATDSPLNSR